MVGGQGFGLPQNTFTLVESVISRGRTLLYCWVLIFKYTFVSDKVLTPQGGKHSREERADQQAAPIGLNGDSDPT